MAKKSGRKALILTSLLATLALTSVLLLAISPAPLSPDAPNLFAVDTSFSTAPLFRTRAAFDGKRWKTVWVHHSKSRSIKGGLDGGDHFVIGNGNGLSDGEVRIEARWIEQLNVAAPRRDACIAICVVGDFDQTTPTSAQLERLEQLVQALQSRCGIGEDEVLIDNRPESALSLGRYFPTAAFRRTLMR